MYNQKIANIFDYIHVQGRLGLQNKFLENKSGQIFSIVRAISVVECFNEL